MQEISSTQDVQTPINIINIERARDIPGGASIVLSDLINGNVLPQATPLTAPSSGKRSVCKQGIALTGSTTTVIKMTTGSHNFKVGDVLGKVGAKAYAISTITSSNGVDDITVGTAIDTVTAGDFLYECAAESATAALANTPVCISGVAFKIDQTKVIEDIPAYVAASVKSGVIGSSYLTLLKNIDEIGY